MAPKEDSLLRIAQARLSSIVSTISPSAASALGFAPEEFRFPAFDDLRAVPGQPQGCLWGFYDRKGKKDELGAINLLTPALVANSARENIITGARIQLDRPLNDGKLAGMGRRQFEQKIIDHSENSRITGFDDEVAFNTQGGSQWDGLCHFAHQKTRKYYNNLSHDVALKNGNITNGTHNWCDAGGIVGRGVLVDWLRWYENKHGRAPPAPNTRHEIPVQELEETLAWQGTRTRIGDVLIVRTGYGRWWDNTTDTDRANSPRATGVQANEATVRWLYDRHFAAVAGDAIAFEAWAPRLSQGWALHEWLLVQWGTPIGELWDLEKLGQMCEREGRWTFFLTSAPLRVQGGVGSPPQVIAIF